MSPLYTAVIACEPANSVEVAKAAVVPEIGTAPLIAVPLSSKVTVPVAPDVTVAVTVTLAPKVEGLSEDARATVLDA